MIILNPGSYRETTLYPRTIKEGIDITAWVNAIPTGFSKILPNCFSYSVLANEHNLRKVNSVHIYTNAGIEVEVQVINNNGNITINSNINLQNHKLIIQ
jgi:hypothetical protein